MADSVQDVHMWSQKYNFSIKIAKKYRFSIKEW
jgi:hypothetical protein